MTSIITGEGSILGEVDRWRDPVTGAFNPDIDQLGKACDNGPLFTAEAYAVGLISESELIRIVRKYELEPGLLGRYPLMNDFCSWDDHCGVAAVDDALAFRIYLRLESTGWKNPNGDWIGRIPLLRVTVKAAAIKSLSWFEQILAFAAYVSDTFVHKEETSGRILLWLARNRFSDFWLASAGVRIWLRKMRSMYPGGPNELLHIYFPDKLGVTHPIVEAASRVWE